MQRLFDLLRREREKVTYLFFGVLTTLVNIAGYSLLLSLIHILLLSAFENRQKMQIWRLLCSPGTSASRLCETGGNSLGRGAPLSNALQSGVPLPLCGAALSFVHRVSDAGQCGLLCRPAMHVSS